MSGSVFDPFKGVKFKVSDENIGEHLTRCCDTIFENFRVYFNYLDMGLGTKINLTEMVLVNALARHMVVAEQKMRWQNRRCAGRTEDALAGFVHRHYRVPPGPYGRRADEAGSYSTRDARPEGAVMAGIQFKKSVLVTPSGINIEWASTNLDKPFFIVASALGVNFSASPVLSDVVSFQNFAKALGHAMNHFKSLQTTGRPWEGDEDIETTPEAGCLRAVPPPGCP